MHRFRLLPRPLLVLAACVLLSLVFALAARAYAPAGEGPSDPYASAAPIPVRQPDSIQPLPPPPPVPVTNAIIFSDVRVTQGLNWDTVNGVSYRKIAGKSTHLRFQMHARLADRPFDSAECRVLRWPYGGPADELVGTVPGVHHGHVIPFEYRHPDEAASIDCWIGGDLLTSDRPHTFYRFEAAITVGDTVVISRLGGYHTFYRTADYVGVMLQPAYNPWEPDGIAEFPDDYRAHLTGITLDTLQRLLPVWDGVEATRLDAGNAHRAGVRFFLQPEVYDCTLDSMDRATCDANQRARANAALQWFNMLALVERMEGINRDTLRWGMVVVPFTITGGGQSCWGDHRVAGQSISTVNVDGLVMAHELSHCEGLDHVEPCLIPEADAHKQSNTRRQEIMSETKALMCAHFGYNRGDDWVYPSGPGWARWFTNLRDDPYPPLWAAVRSAAESRFYLAGKLYPASNPYPDGEWRPRFSMIFDKPVPLDPPAQSGAYAAVIFDDKGQELVRQPFDASFEEPDDGLKPPFIPLDLLLPFPAGAHRVQVLHGDKVLYETVRPGSGPAIDWVKAAVVDGVAHVTWQAQHPTAPLRFALDFSADDGKTRTRLASGIDATSYDWNTELAPGTEAARLILVASDGFHTVEAMTESFSIPRRAPVARISAPEHQGARTVAGRPLELRGSGFDLNDGLLAGKSLRWTSSLNGLLGSGASLTVSLMPGQHLLTLEAISSAELVGSDTIDLVVLADGDGDGLPDAYEDEYSACLDAANGGDARGDQDKDGMTSLTEYEMGSNPCDPDTDDDQAGDGAEAAAGSDPLDPASQPLPVLGEQPDPLLFAGCLSLPQPQAQQVPIASPNQGYVVASDSSWLSAQRLQDGSLEVKVLCDDIAARGRHSGELLLTAAGRRPMMVSVELLAGGKAAYLPLVLHDV